VEPSLCLLQELFLVRIQGSGFWKIADQLEVDDTGTSQLGLSSIQ